MKEKFPWKGRFIQSVTFFFITALLIQFEAINRMDEKISAGLQALESPLLTKAFLAFTHMGAWQAILLVFLLVLVILCYKGAWGEALFLSLLTALTPLLNALLKQGFIRPRPSAYPLIEISGYSFPSGHTMAAFSLYAGIILLLVPHLRSSPLRNLLKLFCSFMILMVALSRIYLGVHYPTDIIGGIFASYSLLALLALVFQFGRRTLQKS